MDNGRLRPLGWAEMRAEERTQARRARRHRVLKGIGLLLFGAYVGYHVALYERHAKALTYEQAEAIEIPCEG